MRIQPPLTVYFDGNCPLCVAETAALKACDRNDALRLVDCSVAGFDDAAVAAAGLARADLLGIIHARDAAGAWLRGVDVFVAMYGLAGFDAIARLWSQRWLRPIWDRLYPWVARHRMWLSALGLHHAYRWMLRRQLRRAAASCGPGRCAID